MLLPEVVCALKYDSVGKVIKYIYTKKNTTLQKEENIRHNKLMVNMHLALRGGGLMSWSYNTESKINKLIMENNVEMEFHGDDFLQMLMPEEQDKFNLFIADLINNHPGEQQLDINLKLTGSESYTPFRITAIGFIEQDHPLTLFGVWKNLTEITHYRDEVYELQKRLAAVHARGDDRTMRKCD